MAADDKLIQYIDGLVDELRRKVPDAVDRGDVEAIHDARVATRRLKAATELFAAQLSSGLCDDFESSLKKIRRALGGLRDLDVICEHLHKMTGKDATTRSALIVRLKEEREKALGTAAKLNTAKLLGRLGGWWGLREQIADVQTPLRNSLNLQLDQFCQKADAHTLPETVDAPGAKLNPHDLRITGKALRYTLEMAQEAGFDLSHEISKSFKKLQDMLGLWHDYVVLTEKILEICAEDHLGYHDNELQQRYLRLAQKTAHRADTALEKFKMFWLKEGAELRQKISASLGAPAEPPPINVVPTQ